MNVEPYATQTEDYIKKAAVEKAAHAKAQEEIERTKAQEVVRLTELERKEREEQRVGRLLARGRDFLAQGRYEEARKLAQGILDLDPGNVEAKKLADVAFRTGLASATSDTAKATVQETQLSWAETKEAQVPYTPVLVYPKNWEEVMNRVVEAIGTENEEEESEGIKELRNKLEQKVSFDFSDTALPEMVQFLQQLTGATIVLDSKAMTADPPSLTLKMNDMKLGQALDWITKQVGMTYALRDDAIFISTPELIGGDTLLKLYDVTDVTLVVRDFKGDLSSLRQRIGNTGTGNTGASEELDWGSGEDQTGNGQEDAIFSPTALVELIKKTVAPGTWSADSE